MNNQIKVSYYNHYIPLNEEMLVFNANSLNLISLTRENYDLLMKFNKTNDLDNKLHDSLLKRGFLVEDNETKRVEQQYQNLRNGKDKVYNICLLLNNICNLACTYCYQDHKRKSEISKATIDLIINKIIEELSNSKGISLHFFGGEPSLSVDKIRYFCQKAASEGVKNISYHITTNGFQLESKIISELIDIGVENYQITLDGNPEVHNRQRPSIAGKPTYKKIMITIEKILKCKGNVDVRINVTKNNYNKLDKLLTDIANLREKKYVGNLGIAINEAIDYRDKQDNSVYFKDRREYANYVIQIYEQMLEKGFPIPYPSNESFCTMMSKIGFVINADGSIGQCSASNEEKIGHIKYGFKSIEITEKRIGKDALSDEKCKKCKSLPLCYGGCKLLSDMKKDKCNYFKYILPSLMRLNASRGQK